MADGDLELLNLIRKNDEKALKDIINLYFKRVYYFVSKAINDPDHIEQTVTTVFKTLWINRHEQQIESLEEYIFILTCREISNTTRSRSNNNSTGSEELFSGLRKTLASFLNKLSFVSK
ncbi:hypothetical protein ACSBL2_06955 [Pedobacter sp. AW31-3R]|uniref:hypothetical protein n=1 Tax=Pedobacter sp. AW31-3R TaxID=3445781 RepID=UPI003F9EF23C